MQSHAFPDQPTEPRRGSPTVRSITAGTDQQARNGTDERMTWMQALLRGLLIVAYFALATVWLPSWLAGLNPVASLPRALADLVAAASWASFLILGIFGLRWGQRGGWL